MCTCTKLKRLARHDRPRHRRRRRCAAMQVATLGGDSDAIATAITKCMAAGMATKYAVDIAAAKEKQRQIANQSKAKHALELALRTRRCATHTYIHRSIYAYY
jgi:hypothetical protein